MMNTCSCMSVTPRSAVSMDPRAVLSSDTCLMLGRFGGSPTEAFAVRSPHVAQSEPLTTPLPGPSLGGDHGGDRGIFRIPRQGAAQARRPRTGLVLRLPQFQRQGT